MHKSFYAVNSIHYDPTPRNTTHLTTKGLSVGKRIYIKNGRGERIRVTITRISLQTGNIYLYTTRGQYQVTLT